MMSTSTIRTLAILVAALCVALAAASLAPTSAHAQAAADEHAGHAHAAGDAAGDGADSQASEPKQSKVVVTLFWLFALMSIGGSILVITRRNLVSAAMGMIGTFFGIAGLYLLLYATFLALVQVLVYAGAVMVLFVFVIMILNKEEDEPISPHGHVGKVLAAAGLLYLFARIGKVLWQVKDGTALMAPAEATRTLVENGQVVTKTYEFGSLRGVGHTLFTDYIYPFEAVSVVLLVAVVGALAVARPTWGKDDSAVGDAGSEEAAS